MNLRIFAGYVPQLELHCQNLRLYSGDVVLDTVHSAALNPTLQPVSTAVTDTDVVASNRSHEKSM